MHACMYQSHRNLLSGPPAFEAIMLEAYALFVGPNGQVPKLRVVEGRWR